MNTIFLLRYSSGLFWFFSFQVVLAQSAQSLDSGKNVYNQRCLMCHGASGGGDGPVGLALKPSPGKFSEKFNKFTNSAQLKDFIISISKNGSMKECMPSFKDLSSKERSDVAEYLMKQHYNKN